jgi:hypothetical protein
MTPIIDNIQNVKRQSAKNLTLDAEVLNRIALVYGAMRDVLCDTAGQTTSLVEFEKSFPQCNSPGEDVGVWESIAASLEIARLYYPPERYDRKLLYRRLLFMLFGALTDEQLHEEDSLILMRCYRSSSSKRASAEVVTGMDIVTCPACYQQVKAIRAVFCPRCGRKLDRIPVAQQRTLLGQWNAAGARKPLGK